MEGDKLIKCKKVCQELGLISHNTQNRVITLMCEKENCKYLGDYLQGLRVMESLCNYMCLCCCEMEKISPSTVSEFKSRCSMLTKMCGVLEKKLSKEEFEKLRCSEVKSLCGNKFSKKAKKTKKR